MGIPDFSVPSELVQYTVGPWVKIADRRPPDEAKEYLVVFTFEGQQWLVLADWVWKGTEWGWSGKKYTEFMTHWMPLPPLPEENA